MQDYLCTSGKVGAPALQSQLLLCTGAGDKTFLCVPYWPVCQGSHFAALVGLCQWREGHLTPQLHCSTHSRGWTQIIVEVSSYPSDLRWAQVPVLHARPSPSLFNKYHLPISLFKALGGSPVPILHAIKLSKGFPTLAVPGGPSWHVLCSLWTGHWGLFCAPLDRALRIIPFCGFYLSDQGIYCQLLELLQTAVSMLAEMCKLCPRSGSNAPHSLQLQHSCLHCPSRTLMIAATGFCAHTGSLRGNADFFLAFKT